MPQKAHFCASVDYFDDFKTNEKLSRCKTSEMQRRASLDKSFFSGSNIASQIPISTKSGQQTKLEYGLNFKQMRNHSAKKIEKKDEEADKILSYYPGKKV